MNIVRQFETSVNISHLAWHYIPYDMNIQGLSFPLLNRKFITRRIAVQEHMYYTGVSF
jgi:hypothetical protein